VRRLTPLNCDCDSGGETGATMKTVRSIKGVVVLSG
jgi:hypothetical protein